MTQLDAVLAARASRDGRGYRTASLRHRYLGDHLLAIVLWQLGAEPFNAAAIGFGTSPDDRHLVVTGEPRNRDLAFDALLRFARWFNPRFEGPGSIRDVVGEGDLARTRARNAPQVLVANQASVEMLARLGRRLAYLPLDGRYRADPQLVRLGQHLLFLHQHAARPGQQLVVVLTDVLGSHWATPQSSLERQSLAALDAFIDPPSNVHGFYAAAEAERYPVGPLPEGDDDADLDPLVRAFNNARGESTDQSVVKSLLGPIVAHYRPRVARTWSLLWRCLQREQTWPEAPSASRRWDEDRDAYTWHLDWQALNGRRRTRQTPRQAATTLRRLEAARECLLAEEAIDDPMRMIPYLLDHKAVEGQVVRVDLTHREIANVRLVSRPLLALISPDPCLIPPGRLLWWTGHPHGPPWVVHQVQSVSGGSLVVIKLTTSRQALLPTVGDTACFSIHMVTIPWLQRLPDQVPWTHQPDAPLAAPHSIEDVAS